jgi:HD superfamily phosphohydrolase
LRIAALLHDIGHYPLSHVIESVYRRRKKQIIKPKPGVKPVGKLSAVMERGDDKKYGHHERLGAKVITERDEIKQVLLKDDIDPDEIAKIVNGEHNKNPIYDQLMHSGLDADRIDYLMRDANLTGVTYGQIDLDYLLNHLDCRGNTVGVHFKGQHAVEHYLLSRYVMYSTVVYHKTIMGFEAVAKALFDILADEGIVYKNYDDIQKKVNTDDFVRFTDSYFYNMIRKGFEECKNLKTCDYRIYRKYYHALKDRKPLRLIREEKALVKSDFTTSEKILTFITKAGENLYGELVKCKLTENEALFCDLSYSVEGLSPYYLITSGPPDEESQKELINIIHKDNTVSPLIADENSIINRLGKLRMRIARLYVLTGNRSYIKKLSAVVNSW